MMKFYRSVVVRASLVSKIGLLLPHHKVRQYHTVLAILMSNIRLKECQESKGGRERERGREVAG